MEFNDIILEKFSQRETIVSKLMVMGYSNNQIAKNMKLSLCTIKNALALIYQKLEAKNKAHACFILGQNIQK